MLEDSPNCLHIHSQHNSIELTCGCAYRWVLASRVGEMKWLKFSLFAGIVCLGISFNYPNNVIFMTLYLVYELFNTLGMAGRNTLMTRITLSNQRGLGYALFFLPGSIVGAFAPFMAGRLAERVGFGILFNIADALNFATWLIL